jgi:hypothetical protein
VFFSLFSPTTPIYAVSLQYVADHRYLGYIGQKNRDARGALAPALGENGVFSNPGGTRTDFFVCSPNGELGSHKINLAEIWQGIIDVRGYLQNWDP